MAILVQDAFNRANGAIGTADTGQAWVTSTSNFVVSNNKGTVSALDGTQYAYIDASQADVTITADFSGTSSSSYADCPKLFFRGADFTNAYIVRWDGTYWLIAKMVNGTLTNLGTYTSSTAPNSTTTVNVKITCSGSTLNLYINSTLVLTVTDSTYLSATKHGWGSLRVQGLIDNFEVDSASSGVNQPASPGAANGVGSASDAGTIVQQAGTSTASGASSTNAINPIQIQLANPSAANGTSTGSDASGSGTVQTPSAGQANGQASTVDAVPIRIFIASAGTANGVATTSNPNPMQIQMANAGNAAGTSTTAWVVPRTGVELLPDFFKIFQ